MKWKQAMQSLHFGEYDIYVNRKRPTNLNDVDNKCDCHSMSSRRKKFCLDPFGICVCLSNSCNAEVASYDKSSGFWSLLGEVSIVFLFIT